MTAFERGQLAFIQGKPITANPYSFFQFDFWEWRDGWQERAQLCQSNLVDDA